MKGRQWKDEENTKRLSFHILQQFQTINQTEFMVWHWDRSQEPGKSLKTNALKNNGSSNAVTTDAEF